MRNNIPCWRVWFRCAFAHVGVFEDAITTFMESTASFEVEEGGIWEIRGYHRQKPDMTRLTIAVSLVAVTIDQVVPDITLEKLSGRNWLQESLKKFKPVSAGVFFVYGSHYKESLPFGKKPILLDASLAFGSGEHPSTLGCLMALDGMVKRYAFRSFLDMGCGSGILSLAMAKGWKAPVLAVDRDYMSCLITRRNAKANGCSKIISVCRAEGYACCVLATKKPFDCIVSNIFADPLCLMAKGLKRNLAPGGIAILSGFWAHDGNRVFAAYRRLGLKMVKRIEINGWLTLVLRL